VLFRSPGSDELVASFNNSLLFTGTGSMRGWNGLPTNDLAFTPDGSGLLLTTSYHKDVTMFDADSKKILRVFSGHQGYVGRFSINADGSRLATCSPDGTVKLWDVASGQETLSLPVPDPRAIALSPDGQKLVVGTHQGELRVYDSTSGYDKADVSR
jgi:WD40 repeat protein